MANDRTFLMRAFGMRFESDSIITLAKRLTEARDDGGYGASDMVPLDGIVMVDGVEVAHISYNGRIWTSMSSRVPLEVVDGDPRFTPDALYEAKTAEQGPPAVDLDALMGQIDEAIGDDAVAELVCRLLREAAAPYSGLEMLEKADEALCRIDAMMAEARDVLDERIRLRNKTNSQTEEASA